MVKFFKRNKNDNTQDNVQQQAQHQTKRKQEGTGKQRISNKQQNTEKQQSENQQQQKKPKQENQQNSSFQEIEALLKESFDYKVTEYQNEKTNISFQLTFISTMVDEQTLQDMILPYLQKETLQTMADIPRILPISEVEITKDLSQLDQKLIDGFVLLTINNQKDQVCFIAAQKQIGRNISVPEIEYNVVGPKESFVESLVQNINLIRKKMPIKELIIEQVGVGKLSKTKVAILYIDGLTNKVDVQTVKQRIKEINFDTVIDSSFISQMISDHQHSIIPQILDTERPDRTVSGLAEGKVAVIVDGSPQVLLGPTTLIEFFSSFEDYFFNWIIASFFRLLRIFAVIFSVLMTPIYVAVLTYHYELIPQDLMGIIFTTRRAIPFPPLLEVLFLELTIELLREAGARLPTKVGQTIGIVGGIVIGTASVEAGLTSNVLLIFIGLTALASFTTPIYRMNNTIRILRYPFLFLAQLWGLLGIAFGICLLLAELLRTISLGRPILAPFYPLRVADFKDSFIRLPFEKQAKRPFYLRPGDKKRFDGEKVKQKKDIDE